MSIRLASRSKKMLSKLDKIDWGDNEMYEIALIS